MTRPRGTKATVSTGEPNLRGALVWFVADGKMHYGRVITHLRNGLWRIGTNTGLRVTRGRDSFALLEGGQP